MPRGLTKITALLHSNHPRSEVPNLPSNTPVFYRPRNRKGKKMFNWIRRRRLSPEARQRMLLVAARAEEAIVETHVSNLLDMLDTLDGEIELDRAVELYAEMMSL